MSIYDKKHLTNMFEAMPLGQTATFVFPPVYGGHTVVVRANEKIEGKKVKRFTVFWGPDKEKALIAAPVFHSNKAKEVGAWIAERKGDMMEEPPPITRAA